MVRVEKVQRAEKVLREFRSAENKPIMGKVPES